MNFDFTPYFEKYEAIVNIVDTIFEKIQKEYPTEVVCKKKCSDCCHALFDLSLIEAIYINHRFNANFEGTPKLTLVDRANKADRKIYKLKRDAHKELQGGEKEDKIIARMSGERVRCPMLNIDDICEIYAFRPLTCRIYGIPTSNQNISHSCGRTGFVEGQAYPTINTDKIHLQLYQLSTEMVFNMKTKYKQMGDLLVPLSMAVLTTYDDEYLGLTLSGVTDDETHNG